jgi:hypothetical protein
VAVVWEVINDVITPRSRQVVGMVYLEYHGLDYLDPMALLHGVPTPYMKMSAKIPFTTTIWKAGTP